jgi:general secretion pathway protein I
VAIALAAASRSVALSSSSATEIKMRVLAGFVAENLMSDFAVRSVWPGTGATEGSAQQAGVEFPWRAEIVSTPNSELRRVEIRVLSPEQPPRELRRLVGVVAREN